MVSFQDSSLKNQARLNRILLKNPQVCYWHPLLYRHAVSLRMPWLSEAMKLDTLEISQLDLFYHDFLLDFIRFHSA